MKGTERPVEPGSSYFLPVSACLLSNLSTASTNSPVCLTGIICLDMEVASLNMPFSRPVQHLPSINSFFFNQSNPTNSHYDGQQLKIYNKRPAQRIRNPSSPLQTRGSLKRSSVVKNFRAGAKNHGELSRIKSRVRGGKGKRREQERSKFSLSSLLPSLASFVFGKGGVAEEEDGESTNAGRSSDDLRRFGSEAIQKSDDLRGSQSGTYDEKPQVSIPTEK